MNAHNKILIGLVLAAWTVATETPAMAASQPARGPASQPAAQKAAPRPMVLPFIDDDYTKAVSEARASRKPIFIEAWAPW